MRLTRLGVSALLGAALLLTCAWAAAQNAAPGPPQNLVVKDTSTASATSVQVTFGKSVDDGAGANDVKSYKVFTRVEGGTQIVRKTITATGAAKYSAAVTGLTSGQRIGVGVMAFDGSLNSTAVAIWLTPFYIPPPVNLSITDPTTDNGDTLNIMFAKSSGDSTTGSVTAYVVYKRTQGTQFRQVRQITATGATTYSTLLSGLNKNTSYGIGIRATDGTHYSEYLTGWKKTVDSQKPAPPRNAALINPTGDQGRLMKYTFSNSLDDALGGDVTAYRFYRKTATTSFVRVGNVAATHAASYTFTFKNLTPGTRYAFAATAFDGQNESEKVTLWGDTLPPGPPQKLKVTDVPNDTGTALKVTFDRSVDDGAGAKDVTQYRVFRRTKTTAAVQVGTITANGSAGYTYTASGLTRDTSYGIQVCAWDGFQESKRVAAWATPRDNTPPEPPTNLAVADWPSDDGKALKITFSRSVDDSGTSPKVNTYFLYRAGGETVSGSKIATITATKALTYEYKDATVVRGKTYWYWLRASSATAGLSTPTTRVSGVSVDNRPVLAPSNLTAQDKPYDNGGVVQLAWSKSGDDGAGAKIVTKYFIYRKMANVQQDPTKIGTVAATGAATYSWNDTKVPLELILYEYTVRAVASTGAISEAAGPARAAAEDNNVVVFQPPTNLIVSDVTGDAGGQLLVSWKRSVSEGDVGPPPPPPVVSSAKTSYGGQYEFYRRTATGSYGSTPTFTVQAAGTADPMTYVDTGLTNGTVYYYKARYRRYNQISNFTNEVSATPVKSSVRTADKAGAETTTAATETLSVALLNPPTQLAAGQDLTLEVAVKGEGRSTVYLEYGTGASVSRTAAASGSGDYELQLKLKIANLPLGTSLYVRAVANGETTAASPVATLKIVSR